MRVNQILLALKKAGKPVKTAQLYRYFQNLGIKPAVRQRPAIYPADTAARILAHLGFGELPAPLQTAAALIGAPTMSELRKARKQATKGTK